MLKRGFQFAPGYRLQEFLGRGQFGQVWRATAPGGAAAAVKFIDLSDGQGQKEYDGVRRVKQIRHANLMPITAIWLLDAQGKVIEEAPDEAIETIDLSAAAPRGGSAVIKAVEPSWLVVSMLLGGKSLQQRLRECVEEGLPGIPPKELISYMDESAKGIDFLNAPQHDLGEGPIAIQHSDVKPANIVLIGSSAVVCDFGLARILTRNQVTATSAAGTPAYMAPEAISGKPARTSDQYSLAVTYYHLRTNALPLNDGSLWEVLDAHRQGNLKFSLVSEAEKEVLRKATDLDWEKRFDTNVEMVDALREALRSEGHNKPTFVPSNGQFPAAPDADPAMVNTLGAVDDVTARIGAADGNASTVSPTTATATLASMGVTEATGAVLKTLLLSDLVDSTKIVETLGDEGAAALFRLHDRAARDLLARYGGREIDKTDGFLMLFERPLNAALYAQAYHQALADLSKEKGTDLAARVGIHIGEVILYENPAEDVARGAKAIEAEGLAKPMAARLMSLAQPRQTLITRGFYDVAKRSAVGGGEVEKKLVWRQHGNYLFKGVEDPIAVFEVGIEGLSPLSPPPESAKVSRVGDGESAEMVRSRVKAAAGPAGGRAATKGNPKIVAAAVGGVLVLILLGVLAFRPGKQTVADPGPANPNTLGVGGVTPPLNLDQDADALLAQALSKFGDDETAAVTLFRNAIEIDPGLSVVPMKELAGHKSGVMYAVATPDGKKLVTAADAPMLWDLSAKEIVPVPLPGHTDLIESMSMNPAGDRLVTAGYDKTPLVWNLAQSDVAGSALPLTGHADAVLGTAWHPSEPIVVTTSSDPSIGVWQIGRASDDAPNGTVAKSNRFTTTETMTAAAIDSQAKWLATISDPIGGSPAVLAYRWDDVSSSLTVKAAPAPITVTSNNMKARRLAFLSEHDNVAVLAVGDAGGSISIYELSNPPSLLQRSDAHTTFVESMRVMPKANSDVIVSGSSDGSAQWWQTGAANREQKQFFGPQPISSVDVSSNGRWVAAGSHDGSVWLWDPTAAKFTATQLTTGSMVHVVRIDPKSQWLIAGCEDGLVRLWDLKTAQLLALAQPTPIGGAVDGPTKTIDSQPLARLAH